MIVPSRAEADFPVSQFGEFSRIPADDCSQTAFLTAEFLGQHGLGFGPGFERRMEALTQRQFRAQFVMSTDLKLGNHRFRAQEAHPSPNWLPSFPRQIVLAIDERDIQRLPIEIIVGPFDKPGRPCPLMPEIRSERLPRHSLGDGRYSTIRR